MSFLEKNDHTFASIRQFNFIIIIYFFKLFWDQKACYLKFCVELGNVDHFSNNNKMQEQ